MIKLSNPLTLIGASVHVRFAATSAIPFLFLLLAPALPTAATTIDFDAQAANKGGNLTGTPDSPSTVGIATLTGGELLTGEVGQNADNSGVYASEGLFGSGETNPVTITFAAPVDAFSVLI